MPYYIAATMHSLIGEHPFLGEAKPPKRRDHSSKRIAEKDIPRETFFAESQDAKRIQAALQEFPETADYVQGQFTGRVLQHVFACQGFPFRKSNDDPRHDPSLNTVPLFYKAFHAEKGFIFMQEGEVCALSFEYLPSKSNPQWFVALLRGVNKPQEQCRVDMLSSEKPGEFLGFSVDAVNNYRPKYEKQDFASGYKKLRKEIKETHIRDVLELLFPAGMKEMSSTALGVADYPFPYFGSDTKQQESLFAVMQRLKRYAAIYSIFANAMLSIARHLGSSEKGRRFMGIFADYESHSVILKALDTLVKNPTVDHFHQFKKALEPIKVIVQSHQKQNSAIQTLWFKMLAALRIILGIFSQTARENQTFESYKKTRSLRMFESGLIGLSHQLNLDTVDLQHDNYQASV